MRHFELFSNTVPMILLHFQGFQFLLFLYFRCEYESPISTLVWFRVHKTLIKLWPVATVLVATSKTLANLKTKSPKLRPRGQKVTARCQWNNWRLMSCPEVIIQQLTRLWMHYYYYWPSLQYLAIDNEKPKNHHPKIYLNYTPSPPTYYECEGKINANKNCSNKSGSFQLWKSGSRKSKNPKMAQNGILI